MRMYILVRESIPIGFAILGAAHAAVACTERFRGHDDVEAWLSGPFRKVICKVTDAELERAKELEDHVRITESALDGAEVAVAFRPRAEWPKAFRFLKLYR